MIISRTPFRISFFGGGTDYPSWYKEHGGAVLSTTIDKYCYVICRYLPPFFDYKYRIRYTKREETKTIAEIQHPSVRECLRFLDIERGVEIQHNADLPAMSGLGSSSSFTVGLLHALYGMIGKMVTKRQLALDGIVVEQERIKENVGSQDQTSVAFGGFNKIVFDAQRTIEIHPLVLSEERSTMLQRHMMLFFIGFPREASIIAGEQIKNIPRNREQLKTMKDIVAEASRLLSSDNDIDDEFGRLLNENWKLKRSLASQVSNNHIDDLYKAALDAGALGAKLLGAGGGGFMLVFARPEVQPQIREKLKDLLCVPFHFETLGTQIIFFCHDDYAKDVL